MIIPTVHIVLLRSNRLVLCNHLLVLKCLFHMSAGTPLPSVTTTCISNACIQLIESCDFVLEFCPNPAVQIM